ncbi:MAG TPA: hypothetical protein VK186_28505 [Candidatus Deferrimicrobium sp.]|nr:hypothetical protein [Candidatus Deferrimicrobium sp.]
MKNLAAIIFFSLLWIFPQPSPAESFLKEMSPPLTGLSITVKPEALLKQIDAVLVYFQKYKNQDPKAIHAGLLSQMGITLADIENTLRFLKATISEDMTKGIESRLNDPLFLQKHFRFIKWRPQPQPPIDSPAYEKIRITKYAVFTIDGALEKNDYFKYALYGLPNDERGLTLQGAEKKRDSLSRFRYTRQQVLNGVYEQGGAEPLVWVTRQGLEEALLEGTICVALEKGVTQYFNVDRANDISYDPSKSPGDQARYWYFARVQQPRGYGLDIHSQLPIYAGAALAGDVYNLGLGKVMGILYNVPGSKRKKMILGILADTGGAFSPNLFQLDYYLGVLHSRNEFNRLIKTLPEFAEVFFITPRRGEPVVEPLR